jgi:hypothetical protein
MKVSDSSTIKFSEKAFIREINRNCVSLSVEDTAIISNITRHGDVTFEHSV